MLVLLFSAVISAEKNYCIRTEDDLPQCIISNYTLIQDIDELYSEITESDVFNVEIINTKNTTVMVNATMLKNANIVFRGIEGSVIQLFVKHDKVNMPTKLGFYDIEVEVDSDPIFSIREIVFYNVQFRFSSNVELKAHSLEGDLRSISSFAKVNVTNIVTTANKESYMPTKSSEITVRTSLELYAPILASTIQMDPLSMNLFVGDINILFSIINNCQVMIYHSSKSVPMTLNINDEEYGELDIAYKIHVSNSAEIGITYKQYILNPSPVVDVYLSGGARMVAKSQSILSSTYVQGSAIIDFTESVRKVKFSRITVEDEGNLVFIGTPQSIEVSAFNFIGLSQITSTYDITIFTSILEFSKKKEVYGFCENIKFIGVVKMINDESYATLPSVQFVNPQMDLKFGNSAFGGISINNIDISNPTFSFNYQETEMPSDKDIETLVTNTTNMFCARDIQCEKWQFTKPSMVKGFSNENSLMAPQCRRRSFDGLICFGFQLENYPSQVYPTVCYSEDPNFCPKGNIIVNAATASLLSEKLSDKAKDIELSVLSPMPAGSGFDFDRIPNPVNVKISSLINTMDVRVFVSDRTKTVIRQLLLVGGCTTFISKTQGAPYTFDIQYLRFSNGASLSASSLNTIDFTHISIFIVDLDGIGSFSLEKIPNAKIPIPGSINITFHPDQWAFQYDNNPVKFIKKSLISNASLLIHQGSSINIFKGTDSGATNPLRLGRYEGEIGIDYLKVGPGFNDKDKAIIFTSRYSTAIQTMSAHLPLICKSDYCSLFIDSKSADIPNLTLQSQNLPRESILEIRQSSLIQTPFYIQQISLSNSTRIEFSRSDLLSATIQELYIEPSSSAKVVGFDINSNISLDSQSSLNLYDCDLVSVGILKLEAILGGSASHVMIHNDTQSLTIPQRVEVTWSVLPNVNPISSSYHVIELFDQVENSTSIFTPITFLNVHEIDIKDRNVVALLSYPSKYVQLDLNVSTQDNAGRRMMLVIIGVSVMIILMALILYMFVCRKGDDITDLPLLSGEQ